MRSAVIAAPVQAAETPSHVLRENPPNARRTMEALRDMGYDSYSSVLDVVDNCVDAEAKNVTVSVRERQSDIVIEILDDGCGMNAETLFEALKLGSDTPRPPAALGKFGMGLVTASIGLSKQVEVFTRERDGQCLHGGFDLDLVASEDRFLVWAHPASDEEARSCPDVHGTLIRLSKTDKISTRHTTSFANGLSKRMGQVYRKFLKSGLRMSVNGRDVVPFDPLMLSDPETRVVLETEIPIEGGGAAPLRVVDLPDYGAAGNRERGIIPQNSGFYIVRNNREIMEAHTFDWYKRHPDFSHFRAEICFDDSQDIHFHTDVKKMGVYPTQSFLDRLRQLTQGLIMESGRRGRARSATSRGQIDHSLAEGNIVRRASLIPKKESWIEKRVPRGQPGTHKRGNGQRERNAHVTELRTASGLKVTFEEANNGEQPFYSLRQAGRALIITYNREHPFWRELMEHAEDPKAIATIDYLVFALANCELLVPEQATVVKANINSTLIGLLV